MIAKDTLRPGIFSYKNFVLSEQCAEIIKFADSVDSWSGSSFEKSYATTTSVGDLSKLCGLNDDFFINLEISIGVEISNVFVPAAIVGTPHIQRWDTGAVAHEHSDNSELDGTPNGFEELKYAAILYLNDNYGGGKLQFPEHRLSIKPEPGTLVIFSGGIENIHRVTEVTSGSRYTLTSFWNAL